MRVCCISDSHEQHRNIKIPDADLLIHAGDISYSGEPHVIYDFIDWFESQPHKHKAFLAGNHDFFLEDVVPVNRSYLYNSGMVVEGLNIWGSPITPTFGHWAFMKNRGMEIKEIWDLIPENTDILITHGPPMGILDVTPRGVLAGCEELRAAVDRVKPRLSVFGHIHAGYGMVEKNGTIFVNASSCNEDYDAVNEPIVIDL